jgi:class 3 adenylate cyclase
MFFFFPEISHDPWQVIEDHGGVVLEFIGDAIQCIYGAPLHNESHPIYAVEAMQNMAPLDTKNGTDSTRDVPRIHIYTYIHTYTY